jgi:hypothetical protein
MNQSMKQTWVGKASLNAIAKLNPSPHDQHQAIVQKTAEVMILFLNYFLLEMIPNLEVELTLKQGHHDERLARGMNEEGLIRPDFGKEFVGYYYKDLIVQVKVDQAMDEETKTFITRYVEGLMMTYLLQNPSKYSNWEFHHRHRSTVTQSSHHPSSAALKINFPQIQIKMG